MNFASRVQVLKLNEPRPWKNGGGATHSAECILLDDKGGIVTVGRLRIPTELQEKVKGPGVFRGAFSLKTATFGDRAGEIVAVLTDLTPEPSAKSS